MMQTHDLPADVVDWLVRSVNGREITRLERHLAKREAWAVDMTLRDGAALKGFLRLDRHPQAGDPWPLSREVEIVKALANSPVPVPRVHASGGPLDAVLFERVPGRADLQNASLEQQRPVMEHFMDILADWHALDVDTLPLPPMPRPKTAYDCALSEMELVLKKWGEFLAGYCDPLLTYGVDWLKRHAPPRFEKLSLLHGDAGPVNFMFEGKHVTSVIDWEWAHLGDPMEDLGNLCVREFWNPVGGMQGLLQRYEKRSGIRTDPKIVQYYRVQTQMRGMVPIAWMTETRAHPREPLAWWLCYRYIGDRATVEAIAECMDLELTKPPLPTVTAEGSGATAAIADAAAWVIREDLAPVLTTPFTKSRANEAEALVRCLERLHRYEAEIDRLEREDLGALLGKRPASTRDGLKELDDRIRSGKYEEEAVLRYLANRAYRAEWLYEPAARFYPNRKWSAL